MIDRRNWIWFCATPLIVLGLLLMAFLPFELARHMILGYLFGTFFGQTTLAAAWTSWGPMPLLWRLPLSLLWLLALVGAIACNISLYGGPGNEVTFVLAACIVSQFAFLQLPFWALVLTSGRRLRYRDARSFRPDPKEMQFGIRQLMIFTTIIAFVLGAGRFVITYLPDDPNLNGEAFVFVFLAAAAVIVTLPLILAALLPRFAFPSVALVLTLVGILTAFEVPLLEKFHRGGGPDTLHIVFINGFTAAWILAVVLLVRVSGYGFGKPGSVMLPEK